MAAPVARAWLVGRGRRGEARRGACDSGALVAAWRSRRRLALSPPARADAVEYHLDRPVQIESAARRRILTRVDEARRRGARRRSQPPLGRARAPAADALVVGFARAAAGRRVVALDPERAHGVDDAAALLIAALGSAVAAFAALGKVLSPQFLLWLVPLAALALAWRLYALGVVTRRRAGGDARLVPRRATSTWSTARTGR